MEAHHPGDHAIMRPTCMVQHVLITIGTIWNSPELRDDAGGRAIRPRSLPVYMYIERSSQTHWDYGTDHRAGPHGHRRLSPVCLHRQLRTELARGEVTAMGSGEAPGSRLRAGSADSERRRDSACWGHSADSSQGRDKLLPSAVHGVIGWRSLLPLWDATGSVQPQSEIWKCPRRRYR